MRVPEKCPNHPHSCPHETKNQRHTTSRRAIAAQRNAKKQQIVPVAGAEGLMASAATFERSDLTAAIQLTALSAPIEKRTGPVATELRPRNAKKKPPTLS
jgi:hypothetical protein